MKNLKILGISLFSMSLLFSGGMTVNAESTQPYFENVNGATLTEEQFNRLSKFFSIDTLNSMTAESIDMLKDETDLKSAETIKYIKTDEYYDRDGNLVNRSSEEISEEEAINGSTKPELEPYGHTITHTTSMKRITMTVTGSASVKSTTIKANWLSIPAVKSYDVIGLRPVSGSLMLNSNSASLSGYQKYDGNYIYYKKGGSNDKVVTSGVAGVAFAMNIVDSTSSSLEMSMNLTVGSNYSPYNIYGAYEHATTDVSLNEALNFNFSYYGLGNCFLWNNNIGSKYDATAGVYLSYNVGDEVGL